MYWFGRPLSLKKLNPARDLGTWVCGLDRSSRARGSARIHKGGRDGRGYATARMTDALFDTRAAAEVFSVCLKSPIW